MNQNAEGNQKLTQLHSKVTVSAQLLLILITVLEWKLSLAPVNAQTWTQTGAPLSGWSSVASSADGAKLVAVGFWLNVPGAIYTSTNAGVTWYLSDAPGHIWDAATSSADGKYLAVASGGP